MKKLFLILPLLLVFSLVGCVGTGLDETRTKGETGEDVNIEKEITEKGGVEIKEKNQKSTINNPIKVYFVDNQKFIDGQDPYEDFVERNLPEDKNKYVFVLDQYFKGPTKDELVKNPNLKRIYSGVFGFSNLVNKNGILHVYLTDECNAEGAAYNLSNLINKNLKQFSEVKAVKIYDQNGETAMADGADDSIPFCLEP